MDCSFSSTSSSWLVKSSRSPTSPTVHAILLSAVSQNNLFSQSIIEKIPQHQQTTQSRIWQSLIISSPESTVLMLVNRVQSLMLLGTIYWPVCLNLKSQGLTASKLITAADTNIRLSQADLDALDRTDGIALPDGGYLGILNVYHQLHCIVNRMNRSIC